MVGPRRPNPTMQNGNREEADSFAAIRVSCHPLSVPFLRGIILLDPLCFLSPEESQPAAIGFAGLFFPRGSIGCQFYHPIGLCCMAGLKQSKRVSWAKELHQVILISIHADPSRFWFLLVLEFLCFRVSDVSRSTFSARTSVLIPLCPLFMLSHSDALWVFNSVDAILFLFLRFWSGVPIRRLLK